MTGQLPDVVKLHEEHKGAGLEIIGISLDASAAVARGAAKRHDLDWRQVCDELKWASPLCVQARVEGIPSSLVFDRSGTLRGHGARGLALVELVEALLLEPYPKTR